VSYNRRVALINTPVIPIARLRSLGSSGLVSSNLTTSILDGRLKLLFLLLLFSVLRDLLSLHIFLNPFRILQGLLITLLGTQLLPGLVDLCLVLFILTPKF
jgi:hypothetical protein